MRKFKDITKEELNNKVSETLYYYLLCDIVEARKANDTEAFNNALVIAADSWSKRDALAEEIEAETVNSCEAEDSYDDFEDSLFVATEHVLY